MITVQVRNGEAFAKIQKIIDMFPLAVEDAAQEFGKSLERRMKREVAAKGLIWRGKLYNGIKWWSKDKELRIPVEGIYIDDMRPHWVKLKRGRLIRLWAKEKGIFQTEGKPYKGVKMFSAAAEQRSIFVRPHPWIRAPTQRTIDDLPRIIKRHTSKVVNSRGQSK